MMLKAGLTCAFASEQITQVFLVDTAFADTFKRVEAIPA
jgi:hypothetical protein